MSTQRDTKEILTPMGNKLVVKSYATAREFNDIQNCYLKDAKVKLTGGVPQIEGFDPASDFEATKKAIELLVVSISDRVTDIVTYILDEMPVSEFDFIKEVLDELTGKKKASEPTKP